MGGAGGKSAASAVRALWAKGAEKLPRGAEDLLSPYTYSCTVCFFRPSPPSVAASSSGSETRLSTTAVEFPEDSWGSLRSVRVSEAVW